MNLVRGLLINEQRFGYPPAPAGYPSENARRTGISSLYPVITGILTSISSIACYCALYVSDAVPEEMSLCSGPSLNEGRQEARERLLCPEHPPAWLIWPMLSRYGDAGCAGISAPAKSPLVCPVCKATKDRFERFMRNACVQDPER